MAFERDQKCRRGLHLVGFFKMAPVFSPAQHWRHRFLALSRTNQPKALTGKAEADETRFLLSFNRTD
jgi:hypothetical protein